MEKLLDVINSGYISHAYIFIGSREDLREKAKIIAMAINCTSHSQRPCGICSSCRRIKQGVYPDVFEVFPKGNSIGIDKIRNITLSYLKKPVEGRRKIYILFDAQKMTQQAQNSLLKTLEEPATQSITMLVCDNIKTLLPTVVSRCQVYDFSKDSTEKLPSDVRKKVAETILSILTEDYSDICIGVEEILQLDIKEEDLLEFCLSFMRDVLIYKTSSKAKIYNKELTDFVKKCNLIFSLDSIIKSINLVVTQLKACKSKGNKNLIWFNLFFKLREVTQSGYRCRCSV